MAIWPWNWGQQNLKGMIKTGNVRFLRGSHIIQFKLSLALCLGHWWPEHRYGPQTRSSSAGDLEGVCSSVGSWWRDGGWLPTSSLCSAAEPTVLGLQTHCFSGPEPDLEESSPKGNVSAAGDCSWSSNFCSFWLLHVGCQLLLGCKRYHSVKMFCIVFCWPEQRRSLEVSLEES